MIPYSILDLCPIPAGSTAAAAFRNSLELAQHAEALGYHRYWLAEHHNMPGIASAATSIVIAHIAAGTKTIRVGSGGVMLPNHSPLVIAEQFGTLASLFPGRIDLGLGRAPGTDMLTARALRRSLTHPENFPDDVAELQAWFLEPEPGQKVRAVPGAGLEVPIWLLGSSLYSAQLAAEMGLPFAFASHFAPADLREALRVYRSQYRPSEEHPRPYAMIGVNVVAADTDAQARYLFTSVQQAFTNLQRGRPGQIPAPIDQMDPYWTPEERVRVNQMLASSVVGSPETVRVGLAKIVETYQPDELILTAHIYEQAARLRSFELIVRTRNEQ